MTTHFKKSLSVALIIIFISQLYLTLFIEGFRISAAVVLFPVLILTYAKNVPIMWISFCTSGIVFVVRLMLALLEGKLLGAAVVSVLPGALFYLCYGMLFFLFVRERYALSYTYVVLVAFLCDCAANTFELLLIWLFQGTALRPVVMGQLILICIIRSVLVGICIYTERRYRDLLSKEEHEQRYRQLFLMTTGLKSETYFMKKNSEEIEAVMTNAYKLYERLATMEAAQELQTLALTIAKDVHEIKKDYLRIIQGIEKEIDNRYEEEKMEFSELLQILKDTTYHTLSAKRMHVELDFQCDDDFMTGEHYSLMVILRNLTNNAIEAIETIRAWGNIRIHQRKQDGYYVITVADNGPGIKIDRQDDIFLMGYSTKFDEKTGNINRGVGLCGVKMVVESFGGTIEVDSKPGKGTIFTIKIMPEMLEGE